MDTIICDCGQVVQCACGRRFQDCHDKSRVILKLAGCTMCGGTGKPEDRWTSDTKKEVK